MPRSRRAFLAAVGASASLAGCVARAPTADVEYRVSASVAEPADDSVDYSVEASRPFATTDRPALVRSTYENTGDETTTVTVSPARPQRLLSEQSAPGIALLEPGEYEQEEPGGWMPTAGSIHFLLGLPVYDLVPGDSVSVEHEVWADPKWKDSHPRLVPGTYRVDVEARAKIDVSVEAE